MDLASPPAASAAQPASTHRLALVDGERRLTHAALHAAVLSVAAALQARDEVEPIG